MLGCQGTRLRLSDAAKKPTCFMQVARQCVSATLSIKSSASPANQPQQGTLSVVRAASLLNTGPPKGPILRVGPREGEHRFDLQLLAKPTWPVCPGARLPVHTCARTPGHQEGGLAELFLLLQLLQLMPGEFINAAQCHRQSTMMCRNAASVRHFNQ